MQAARGQELGGERRSNGYLATYVGMLLGALWGAQVGSLLMIPALGYLEIGVLFLPPFMAIVFAPIGIGVYLAALRYGQAPSTFFYLVLLFLPIAAGIGFYSLEIGIVASLLAPGLARGVARRDARKARGW